MDMDFLFDFSPFDFPSDGDINPLSNNPLTTWDSLSHDEPTSPSSSEYFSILSADIPISATPKSDDMKTEDQFTNNDLSNVFVFGLPSRNENYVSEPQALSEHDSSSSLLLSASVTTPPSLEQPVKSDPQFLNFPENQTTPQSLLFYPIQPQQLTHPEQLTQETTQRLQPQPIESVLDQPTAGSSPGPLDKSEEDDKDNDSDNSDSEEEPPRKRARKDKTSKNNATTVSSFVLPPDQIIFTREELLHINSEQFENHIQKIILSRKLTSEEHKAAQFQRRLIKNRESAQASRKRKKSYHEVLESRMAELTTVTSSLRQNMYSLTSENAVLRDEVNYLTKFVQNLQIRRNANR